MIPLEYQTMILDYRRTHHIHNSVRDIDILCDMKGIVGFSDVSDRPLTQLVCSHYKLGDDPNCGWCGLY